MIPQPCVVPSESTDAPVHKLHGVNGWLLLSTVSALGAVLLNRGPMLDPDVYWHTLVGQYTLDGKGFPFPDPWSLTVPDAHWHSTSWLSEIALAVTYNAFGYAGLIALRFLLLLGLLVALYLLLARRSRGWQGPTVFAVAALTLAGFVQERPQSASLIFTCWLAAVARQVLLHGDMPIRWRLVLVTYAWALIHGLFVLVPFVLVLLAMGMLLDRGPEARRRATSLLVSAGVATAVAALTPMGPRLLLAPVTVGGAAKGYISEWAPTRLDTFGSWGFAAMSALIVVAWSRSRVPTPRSQLLWLIVIDVFAFAANRNVAPATILLAPLALAALEHAWPASSSIRIDQRLVTAVGAAGLCAVTLSYASAPVLGDNQPQKLVETLAAQQGVTRVLNDYNVSGYLLREAWPHVRVAVDGRADRYGAKELQRYSDAVNGAPGWRDYVEDLQPDAALLTKEQALTELLIGVERWQVVRSEGAWVLLAPPGSSLLETP